MFKSTVVLVGRDKRWAVEQGLKEGDGHATRLEMCRAEVTCFISCNIMQRLTL